MRAGYLNTTDSSGLDGPLEDRINALSVSGPLYPHILQMSPENFAFLPVHAGESVPVSYSGVAYFGSPTSQCDPARLNGTLTFSDRIIKFIGIIEVPFDANQIQVHANVTAIYLAGVSMKQMPTTFLAGAWTILRDFADADVRYIFTMTFSLAGFGPIESDFWRAAKAPSSPWPMESDFRRAACRLFTQLLVFRLYLVHQFRGSRLSPATSFDLWHNRR